MRYRARRPPAHRPVAVGRVDVGIGQNAARLTAVFGRNNRLNNMYFTPSEDPVTPSSSPVMWGYATTLGVHMPMVHLADSSQTKIAAPKQPNFAYFTPSGQNFLRLRRAYKALRVGGTACPGPPPGRAPPSGPTRWSGSRGRRINSRTHGAILCT